MVADQLLNSYNLDTDPAAAIILKALKGALRPDKLTAILEFNLTQLTGIVKRYRLLVRQVVDGEALIGHKPINRTLLELGPSVKINTSLALLSIYEVQIVSQENMSPSKKKAPKNPGLLQRIDGPKN